MLRASRASMGTYRTEITRRRLSGGRTHGGEQEKSKEKRRKGKKHVEDAHERLVPEPPVETGEKPDGDSDHRGQQRPACR